MFFSRGFIHGGFVIMSQAFGSLLVILNHNGRSLGVVSVCQTTISFQKQAQDSGKNWRQGKYV